jgi:hypothetical protein
MNLSHFDITEIWSREAATGALFLKNADQEKESKAAALAQRTCDFKNSGQGLSVAKDG